jgi:hypothetical protein
VTLQDVSSMLLTCGRSISTFLVLSRLITSSCALDVPSRLEIHPERGSGGTDENPYGIEVERWRLLLVSPLPACAICIPTSRKVSHQMSNADDGKGLVLLK